MQIIILGKIILDILPVIFKILASVGFFAALSKLLKKILDKNKIAKLQKIEDRKVMMEVLEKVGMIEPQLHAINVKLNRLTENQRVILNMQDVAFLVFDSQGYCEYASPALCKLIMHPESRILGSGWLALLIEQDIDRVRRAWNFAMETSSVFDETFTYRESKIKVHCIAFHNRDHEKKYDGSFAQLTILDDNNL